MNMDAKRRNDATTLSSPRVFAKKFLASLFSNDASKKENRGKILKKVNLNAGFPP